VTSYVVLKPGMQATDEELRDHCRSALSHYKVPREIHFRTELPKSAALKILRRELKAEAMKEGLGRGE
jgi:long-chain acyl-CoA synthetase